MTVGPDTRATAEMNKKLACTECGREFSRLCALRLHVQRNHSELVEKTRRYPGVSRKSACDNMSSSGQSNQLMQSGEKPHACSYCDRRFRCAAILHMHAKKSHTGQKVFFVLSNWFKFLYHRLGFCVLLVVTSVSHIYQR